MPGVVLHVVGEEFDPFPVLAMLSLQPYAVFRKGDKCLSDSPTSQSRHRMGGFKCEVSDADGLLKDEVPDTIAFLKRHYADLQRLGEISAIDSMYLDFGHYLRLDEERVMVQCDYLPPELLRMAGELGIGIELSLYPRAAPNVR